MKRRHALPASVYALVDETPATVLLEGGSPRHAKDNRSREEPWTRLFTAPLRVCAAHTPAEIPGLFREIESAVRDGLWAAGFFSYECGECFEPTAPMRRSPEAPLAWFGIYERSYGFDHESGRFADGEPPGLTKRFETGSAGETGAERETEFAAEFSIPEAEYSRRIAAIQEWIRAGDVYQLNFTAPWRIEARGSAAALYARLRGRQPVEYGAFLHWQPGRRILSFSPELFFRLESAAGARRIVTRPMKGTAPRGRTTREDCQHAEWLRSDPKNRSENVMIVDLLRNDLGRLAKFGSVRAERLFEAERYPTLWQMTSTITAELRDDAGFEEIFRALFPCGSITGAPKVRAMQLIAEIEDQPRGVYTGAIGFFSPQRTVFNVAIRTLELDGARGTMGVGSGIVIDSAAADEYRECLLKAEFLTRSSDKMPAEFSLIETMLWDSGFPLIELHLDRLTDSAEYFDIECDRAEVRAALDEYVRRFTEDEARRPQRVRLLVNREGGLTVSAERLDAYSDPHRMGRVRLSSTRTDPADPLLFHKTTHRPLYAAAFKAATRDGLDDVLFLNLRGELTEGAISNVFIEKDGRWLTPPVECGLLAGVYRRHLLETRTNLEERVLREDDLRSADAVYLANAVRGLRKVEVDWREN
jgi:para-aminobenzoate synthetase/4-amino-4-deoxychorismate lyase